jgi:XTP/dITP diphosphohydrolase
LSKIKIVIGTRNKNKLSEILNLLTDLSEKFEFLPVSEFTEAPIVIEDEKTTKENAIRKARQTAEKLKLVALAEDTGLEVEYLDGLPGVISARFAGEGCTYEDNNKKLLSLLDGVPFESRKAKFRCIAAVALPDSRTYTCEGKINGYIATEIRGTAGFGYDPVFIVPEYNKTFAELGSEIKNKISHRAIAFEKIKKILLEILL